MTTRIVTDNNGRKHITTEQLLHLPQRTWVGLTDEDKDFIVKRASVYDWHDYEVIEATEAKLRSKNDRND